MKESDTPGAAALTTLPAPPSTSGPGRRSPVRERMLDSALQLFYAEGIRATSADRIISDARTTKASFYSHFPTKDHLVLAYLNEQAALEHEEMAQAASAEDPAVAAQDVVDHLVASSCADDFHGCPFINAAAEYPDPRHPVRTLVAEHRAWWRSYLGDLARKNGVAAEQADALGYELMALRDGILLANHLDPSPDLRGCAERMLTLLRGR